MDKKNNLLLQMKRSKGKITLRRTIVTRSFHHRELFMNQSFNTNFYNQVAANQMKCAEDHILKRINSKLTRIREIVNKQKSSKAITTLTASNSVNASTGVEEMGLDCSQFIPSEQWVYETPEKQKLRQVVFESASSSALEPAVFHASNDGKTVYEITDLAAVKGFSADCVVPAEYLEPVCTIGADEEDLFIEETEIKEETIENVGFQTKSKMDVAEGLARTLAAGKSRQQDTKHLGKRPMSLDNQNFEQMDGETPSGRPLKFRRFSSLATTSNGNEAAKAVQDPATDYI